MTEPDLAAFHALKDRVARIGATPGGGLCRLAASREDGEARDLVAAELRADQATIRIDPVGNLFGVFGFAPDSDAVLLVGSHLDSQPTGGRFDGTYGVLAGVIAARAVAARLGRCPPGTARRNLAVVDWTNEEGARYQPSLIGSSTFIGALDPAFSLGRVDDEGISLGEALAAIGYRGGDSLGLRPVRYVELHVEQGDRLEAAGARIGLVHGAWAARKLSLVFEGAPSHTGPTPMARRRDALRGAARAIDLLHTLVEADPSGCHGSAARIAVTPNSPNVVPMEARVWFEIRHEDDAVCRSLGDRFLTEARAACAGIGVGVTIASDELRTTAHLDPGGIDVVRAVAADLRLPALDMRTISGHDALALQKLVPSTLIFVPSRDGLSHNEAEFTSDDELEDGLRVLTEVLWRLVTRDAD